MTAQWILYFACMMLRDVAVMAAGFTIALILADRFNRRRD